MELERYDIDIATSSVTKNIIVLLRTLMLYPLSETRFAGEGQLTEKTTLSTDKESMGINQHCLVLALQ